MNNNNQRNNLTNPHHLLIIIKNNMVIGSTHQIGSISTIIMKINLNLQTRSYTTNLSPNGRSTNNRNFQCCSKYSTRIFSRLIPT